MISVANCPPAKGESEQLVHRHVRPFGIWQLAESLKRLERSAKTASRIPMEQLEMNFNEGENYHGN